MAWLGFVTLLTIYWCFFVAATTGRIGWCLLTGWRADNQLSEGDAGQRADGADLLCAVSGLPQWAGGAARLECEAEKEAPGAVLAVIYSDFSADVLQRGAGADAGIYSEYPGLGQ